MHTKAAPVFEGVATFPLGDDLVVFVDESQQLVRLNETAAFIWRRFERLLSPSAVAEELVATYGVPRERALADVIATVDSWKRAGLMPDVSSALPRSASEPGFDFAEAASPATGPTIDHVYRLLDTVIKVRFACADAERLAHPAIDHLEIDAADLFDRELDVIPRDGGYDVVRDGTLVDRCDRSSELTPFLHSHLLMTAYTSADYLVALHAAAVGRGEACVVLPAPSGSGKSTLTAALAYSGLDYLTDEVVLLDRHGGRISALPTSLSLKEPSWAVLAPLYPELETLTPHRRRDGKTVRYLPPPNEGGQERRARALVFPRYGKYEPPSRLEPLTPGDALQRITLAGYDVSGGRLDRELVGAIVEWIRNVDCYELRFCELDEAVAHIEALLS